MSRLNESRLIISVPAQRRNTKYTVNIEAVRSLIMTGPANLLLWGDSISSWQANPRLPMGIAMHWPAPNGISGWFMPTFQAATGALANFANTTFESRSWPFVGFDHTSTLASAGFTVTDYDDPNSYATDEVLTGVTSPLPKPCRKIVKSGSGWNFPTFHTTYMGPMGVCQSGRCWAAGDWLTGKGANAIRVGLVHLANSETVATNQTIYTQEGFGNASGAAATTVVNGITITAPATATHEVAWASLAAASVNTPFGTVENEPGDAQNPIHFQYKGIGTTLPGTVMNGTYLAAAGNADWAGAFRVALVRDINNTPGAGTNIIPYGIIIEDTTNLTGLYVDNISFSGDTIRTQLDGATVQQMANALTLNAQRKINWVMMQIGENHTAAEWDSGNINEAQIRNDLIERIARVNAGWDLAGIPRGLITLVSPWETVGGTKSGSAWYTTLASIMRDIASGNPQISFIDLRQMFDDQFSTDELYDAGRNAHMNILFDGVHPSLRGTEYHARFIWSAIMDPVEY
jgi:lysophospholipase L1-like esterase